MSSKITVQLEDGSTITRKLNSRWSNGVWVNYVNYKGNKHTVYRNRLTTLYEIIKQISTRYTVRNGFTGDDCYSWQVFDTQAQRTVSSPDSKMNAQHHAAKLNANAAN